jgi:aryl-alcohol dehydrogenase-like predicted oxidoreductase
VYANEEEAGQGIKESGLSRKDLWITTKWSGVNGSTPRQACEASLEKLGVSSVDLLLIHHPRLTNGDIPGAWKKMEELHKEGKAKSIGVSKCVLACCVIRVTSSAPLVQDSVICRRTRSSGLCHGGLAAPLTWA